jgi:hypothetical protein
MIHYILAFMLFYFPATDARLWKEEVLIARAISQVAIDENEALLLASIASFEGSFRVGARGKLGEIGPWQLMPPPRARAVPKDLAGQAREALYRWTLLGPCGFTGENAGRNPKTLAELSKVCPLAFHRRMRAEYWRAAHPYNPSVASLP